MTANFALLASALSLSLLTAPTDVIVNNCDDAKQWHGASRDQYVSVRQCHQPTV